MKVVFFVGLILVLAGCMKVVDKDEKTKIDMNQFFHSNSLPVRTYATLVDGGVRLNLQSENRPGFYSLYFQYPGPAQDYRIKIVSLQPELKDSLRDLSLQSGISLPHSQTYEIEIWKQMQGGPQKVASFRGRTPKDLVLSAAHQMSQAQSFEAFRVFFLKHAKIQLRQHNLKIIAYEVIAEEPVQVEGFAPSDKAILDQKGSDSGDLLIQAEAVFGFFQFHLRGQNGGDGSEAISHRARAARGSPAVLGMVRVDPEGNFHCVGKSASNGSGAAGKPGHPGKNGRAGGDGGQLSLNVKHTKYFTYEINLSGGQPGKATSGGQGQLGGLPGDASGNGLENAFCGLPKLLGQEGPSGPPGPDGMVEAPGNAGDLCLNINSQQVRCLTLVP